MAKDKAGRPIVVVTGYGVVTSLGAGKQDNWAKLTAGQSGIREITRFATDGLKTRIAGTVDFVSIGSAINAPELSQRFAEMAGEEAVAQSGIRSRGKGVRGNRRGCRCRIAPPLPRPPSRRTAATIPVH